MKIFDMAGNVYFSQRWHGTPIKRLKLRAIKSASSAFGESDELIVLYEDKKAICIEGTGLWMTLRNAKMNGNKVLDYVFQCSAHPSVLDSASPENLSVNYKKWAFASQQEIFDVSILGTFFFRSSSFRQVQVTI
jgi:hypothetical protein